MINNHKYAIFTKNIFLNNVLQIYVNIFFFFYVWFQLKRVDV